MATYHKEVVESLESSHRKKVEAKRDTSIDEEVKAWLGRVLPDANIDESLSLHEILKDGTVLCAIVNKKYPGMIRDVKKSKLAFAQMENIGRYIATMTKFGVPKAELFTTVDLYEEKDMQTVALSLKHLAVRWPSLDPSAFVLSEATVTE